MKKLTIASSIISIIAAWCLLFFESGCAGMATEETTGSETDAQIDSGWSPRVGDDLLSRGVLCGPTAVE